MKVLKKVVSLPCLFYENLSVGAPLAYSCEKGALPRMIARVPFLERIILRWENSQTLCGVFCKKPGTDRTVS